MDVVDLNYWCLIISVVTQACTEDSPYEGPLRIDAPSWCHAPFEPEGILRFVVHRFHFMCSL